MQSASDSVNSPAAVGVNLIDFFDVTPTSLWLEDYSDQDLADIYRRQFAALRGADALVIETKTVKNHINSIYSKLHLNSRYEAITQTLGQRRDASGAVTQEDPHAEDRVHPLP